MPCEKKQPVSIMTMLLTGDVHDPFAGIASTNYMDLMLDRRR